MNLKVFTLIELLMIVAIIGILLTLALPSLGKARELSKIAVCKSNLSQVNQGLFLYMKDNNHRYPDKVATTGKHGWFGKTAVVGGSDDLDASRRPLNEYLGGPYTTTDEVLVAWCPGDDEQYNYKGSSYKNNTEMTWNSLYEENNHSIQIMEINSPERMVVVGEWGLMKLIKGAPEFIDFHESIRKRMGLFNTLFADGRVSDVKFWAARLNSENYVLERDK